MTDTEKLPIKRAAGILLMSPDPAHFLLMGHADRWDLPKGHAEPNESLIETALRETEEETGWPAERIRIDDRFRFELTYQVKYRRGGVFQKIVVYYLGLVEERFTPTLTEHESFEWFPWQPPHRIQTQTIDPLLNAVAAHLAVDQSSADS
ncbi:MAG: NUDIX domain-containing protein [Planctomycetota bacterium]